MSTRRTTGIPADPRIEVRPRPPVPAAAPVGESALRLLEAARARVEPALRATLDRLPASIRPVALYHYGWQDSTGRACDEGRGKALRPALVLLCAQAVAPATRSDPRLQHRAVTAAVAVDLVHNFSLLHDDVMDGDLTRRHRPTAWSVFGTGPAVLAGDALLTLALQTLADLPEIAGRTSAAVQELIVGQIQDLALERRSAVTLTESLDMARAKTGALLGCCCAVGALAADAAPAVADRLDAVGRDLGLAFQLTDDLLGIWGDPQVTGKPAGADLRVRKKSLPVVRALESGTPAGQELARLYLAGRDLTEQEVARAGELVEAAGGRSWARHRAQGVLDSVEKVLCTANLDDDAARGLRSLARLSVHRQS